MVNNLYLLLQGLKRSGLNLPRGDGVVLLSAASIVGLLDGPMLVDRLGRFLCVAAERVIQQAKTHENNCTYANGRVRRSMIFLI